MKAEKATTLTVTSPEKPAPVVMKRVKDVERVPLAIWIKLKVVGLARPVKKVLRTALGVSVKGIALVRGKAMFWLSWPPEGLLTS